MKKKTIIITVLSSLPENPGKKEYNCDYDRNYKSSGYMTNEGGIFKILDEIDREKTDKIEVKYIVSESVRRKYDNGETKIIGRYECVSDEDYFTKIMDSKADGVKIKPYPSKDELSNDEIIKVSSEIMNDIMKESIDYKIDLYIECNGGQRDYVTVLSSIAQTDGENITVRKIVGANGRGKQFTITDKTQAYQITDFYSGVDEFVLYGRAGKLKKYLEDIYGDKETKKIANIKINNLITAIETMSNAFALCYPKAMVSSLEKLNQSIKEYNNSNESEKKGIVDYLARRIERDYLKIFESINNFNGRFRFNNKLQSYEDFDIVHNLIDYCVRHNLIPQALTLFNELVPLIMCNYGFIYPNKNDSKGVENFVEVNKAIGIKKFKENMKYSYYSQYLTITNTQKGVNYPIQLAGVKNFNTKDNPISDLVRIIIEKDIALTKVTKKDYREFDSIIDGISRIREYRNKSNHANKEAGETEINNIVELIGNVFGSLEKLVNKDNFDEMQKLWKLVADEHKKANKMHYSNQDGNKNNSHYHYKKKAGYK